MGVDWFKRYQDSNSSLRQSVRTVQSLRLQLASVEVGHLERSMLVRIMNSSTEPEIVELARRGLEVDETVVKKRSKAWL